MNIFLTGGSSGIGLATKNLFIQQGHKVTAPCRTQLDMRDFATIDSLDLSTYDAVINCAGSNQGAYLGWQNNTWQNQADHVAVNFTGPLLLAKQYTRQRDSGQFVYVSSTSAENPISYTIFMVASKCALKSGIDAVKRDYPNFVFTEIMPGKTRTNMLNQNYQGTKTPAEIDELYKKGAFLLPEQVAEIISYAVNHRLERVTISPHVKQYR